LPWIINGDDNIDISDSSALRLHGALLLILATFVAGIGTRQFPSDARYWPKTSQEMFALAKWTSKHWWMRDAKTVEKTSIVIITSRQGRCKMRPGSATTFVDTDCLSSCPWLGDSRL
jgi:hypothetical protein